MTDAIRVLHVDDEPDFAEMVAEFLEREDDRLTSETARDANEALEQLTQSAIDCVVSDYDMPGQNGIEFLQNVREDFPDLPFILYTGKGSEEVASDAISAGVSDYLQKAAGTEQYELLANRITNAVDQNRAQQQLHAQRHQIEQLHEATRELMGAETRDEIAKLTSDIAREILELPLNGIHFYDPDQNGLVPIAYTDEVRDVLGEPPVIGPGDGIAWTTFDTGEPQIHGDVRDAPEVLNPETPIRSEFHLPLGEHGVLVVGSTRPDDFSETDVTTAKILAANVEAALERAEREQELRRQERQYQAVFDDPNILVGLLDTDGTVLDINETAMDYVDASLDDVTGELLWEPWFKHSETVQREVREWLKRAASGEYVEFEADLLRPTGDSYTVEGVFRPVMNDEGQVVSVLISDRDITEQKEHKRELERYREYTDDILDAIDDLFFVHDEAGNLQRWNQSLREITGYTDKEMETMHGTDFVPVDHQDRTAAAIEQVFETGQGRLEAPLLTKEGDSIPYEYVANLVVHPDGDPRLVGIGRDITSRQERERELEDERDRFRAVFEEAFDAMVLADDTGQYVDVNESAIELFGLPKAELLNRSIEDFAPQDYDFEAAWEEFQKSKDERGIFPLVRADGTQRIVEYAATSNIVPGEHLSVLRDITEEHDYERVIEHLHHTAQEIFRAETDAQVAEVMIAAVDDILGIPINGVAMYDASENVLRPVAETDHSQDLIDSMPTFRPGESLAWEVFETGQTAHYDDVSSVPGCHNPETPIRSEIIVPLGDHGVALSGSTEEGAFDETDVSLVETLANHAETALDRIDRERELERYRTMIETIPDGVYALDEDLRYITVNEGMEQLTGYSEEELIGSHVSIILPEETAETSAENRQKIRDSNGDLVIQFERTHYKADGTPVRCNVRFRALPTDEDGGFRGTVGVLRDVSEQRQREQELERQNTRLEEFASIVSHDLRNPLDVAQGRVELAREECDSDHLDHIVGAHDRMEALIDDILTLAREGEQITEKERVELGSLIEMCWRNVPTQDATVNIDLDRAVLADRSRLTQLLENLIRNAIEHGGEDVRIAVGELAGGFYIEDDGPGIPVGDRDAVFDPGYSTAEAGTGFGLSIVKQVAEAHDWAITVTEGSDGGARFEVTGVEFAE